MILINPRESGDLELPRRIFLSSLVAMKFFNRILKFGWPGRLQNSQELVEFLTKKNLITDLGDLNGISTSDATLAGVTHLSTTTFTRPSQRRR
jgi:hypothetical protein